MSAEPLHAPFKLYRERNRRSIPGGLGKDNHEWIVVAGPGWFPVSHPPEPRIGSVPRRCSGDHVHGQTGRRGRVSAIGVRADGIGIVLGHRPAADHDPDPIAQAGPLDRFDGLL